MFYDKLVSFAERWIIKMKKMYDYLANGNKEVAEIYELKKSANREDFEKHKVKYWIWLILLNFQYRVLLKNSKNIKKMPQLDNRSYKLPPILLENENVKAMEVVSCAFRKHEPKKGLTGGPNGVLATEREVFGDIYHGIRMRYIFHSTDVKYPEHLEKALKDISYMVKINFYAVYYMEYCVNAWCRLNKNKDFFFICHDLGFAYAAYLRNCKYVLIWHTQGSMINERESFGEVLSEEDKRLLNELEKVVFENAEAVYFPSIGAKESYIKTAQIDINKIKFATKPLYNTIPDIPSNFKGNELLKKLELKEINKAEIDIFLSVGDFSDNKGMDRIPNILNQYVEKTGKKIYWIAIGSKHKAGIFEKLCEEKENWKFECSLFGKRIDHDTLLALMEYTDYYIMMQRHSIFDLSTLEAMRAGKALILSDIGGNLEVNKENNVIFVNENNLDTVIMELKKRDKHELGELNKKVFYKYFSKECFFNSYAEMIDSMMHKYGIEFNRKSEINRCELGKWKGKYAGKTAVICGAGSSLDNYTEINSKNIHIALNRALFFDKVKFDILFMQDMPKNQPYTIEDYNKYPCTKFYGIITNPNTMGMGMDKKNYINDINGEIVNYELAPMWYDSRVDEIKFNIDEECVIDAKSVVFSAIQFAVFAGFSEIVLYGVDFSNDNFGENINPNKYADCVEANLISFKKTIRKKYPDIIFRIGSTSNSALREGFEKIDNDEK